MEFMDVVKRRYAVRKFSDKVVPKEVLDQILEVGNAAPTAKNIQPQKIYVLQSKEAIELLDTQTRCRYGAPLVLMFAYDENQVWKNPLEEGIHSGVEDVSIVATHMMLRAAELGVDSIWINFFANSKLAKAYNLPENEKTVLLMPLGYAADGVKPLPSHSQSKDLEEIVKYL